ncbi:hypothetical protein LSM04_003906 [Trypanosoma melophagium]|uniref:uncharacterized protein n=1 Tax=Trypanosoma melophagium TaxID=715481 RepID=UPI00351A0F9B|nr:hypothetical protein LSM04_002298 [Trypanosoma melophagium]KAH9598117.1 hypothetical protein LSM04_003906 [Trypanosoma melophagium]
MVCSQRKQRAPINTLPASLRKCWETWFHCCCKKTCVGRVWERLGEHYHPMEVGKTEEAVTPRCDHDSFGARTVRGRLPDNMSVEELR